MSDEASIDLDASKLQKNFGLAWQRNGGGDAVP